jgi:putative flippase GtrA
MADDASIVRTRSLAVSVVTTVLDAGLFALLSLLLRPQQLVFARAICGGIGALANFCLNRQWVFHRCGVSLLRGVTRYAVVAAGAVALGTLIWQLLWLATALDPRLLQLVSMAAIWLLFTFPLLRIWVFARGD